MLFSGWVKPCAMFDRTTPLDGSLGVAAAPTVNTFGLLQTTTQFKAIELLFRRSRLIPMRRDGILRFPLMFHRYPCLVIGVIMTNDIGIPRSIQRTWTTMQQLASCECIGSVSTKAVNTMSKNTLPPEFTFKHNDVARSEIDLMCTSVKVLNKKRPRFCVFRRGHVQHVSNRM
jgi:hypothetical protein